MPAKTFLAPDMSCAHCAATIEREVGEIEGVAEVSADADSREVTVSWETPADWPAIRDLLEEIGYPPQEGRA